MSSVNTVGDRQLQGGHSDDPNGIFIVGSGLAGYGLAKEIRKLDKDVGITIITADSGHGYSKPMLSTGFTRNMDLGALAQPSAETMTEMLAITLWREATVTAIDTQAQTITLDNHKGTHRYGKLVLAVGAETIRPPIQGNATDRVLSINNLAEYGRFRDAIQTDGVKDICIIGSGLIGCEFTNDLLNGGFHVDTIDPMATCLPTLLPEEAGKAVQRGLEANGARFHFGRRVAEVNRADVGLAVTLDTGDVLSCDLVLSAIGVRPATALAQQADLHVNRGIVTDRFLQTSAANVYAMGDCAEVDGRVLVYVSPIMVQSKALAKTLTGTPTAVAYPAMPVTIKTPACPVCVAPPAPGAQGHWQLEVEGNNVTALFEDTITQALLGFALTGESVKQRMALQKQLPPIMA